MNTRIARRLAAAATASAAALGCAVATGGAAHADTVTYVVSPGTAPYWIAATNTGMPIAVAGAANWAGARIIQWYNTGGDEQKWYFDGVYDTSDDYIGFMLRNKNSGLCIDTDGVAGDVLVQTSCNPYDRGQLFWDEQDQDALGFPEGWDFTNIGTGLKLDVSGASTNEGADIDLWYDNGGINQHFILTQTS
jgi:ricin-type beta-trefoil lectin protein